jgi:hypothetical protein
MRAAPPSPPADLALAKEFARRLAQQVELQFFQSPSSAHALEEERWI